MRLLYTLVFLILTSIVYGQKSTLLQNVNVRAKELKHHLNDTGDSLVFTCERTIYEVVIFNDDFERVIKVKDSEAKIPIADIPVGRYIVEALLSDKLIVITLLRNESFDLQENAPLITDNSNLFRRKTELKKEVIASIEKTIETSKIEVEQKVAVESKPLPLPKKEIFGNENNTNKIDLGLSGKKAESINRVAKTEDRERESTEEKKRPMKSSLSLFQTKARVTEKALESPKPEEESARANRVVSTYWVIYKMNNGQSSEKIQKMGDQEAVDRMIRKNEVDMRTKSGRLNELTVWTVYDTDNFVKHKRKNKKDYMNIASESFNVVPYYSNKKNTSNL